jgi:hypothetical protein
VNPCLRGVPFGRRLPLQRGPYSTPNHMRRHRQATPSQIIGDLGPLIRGWANYYRHGASKHAFHSADHHVRAKLWR